MKEEERIDYKSFADMIREQMIRQRIKDNALVCLLFNQANMKFTLTKEMVAKIPLIEFHFEFSPDKESIDVWLEKIEEEINDIPPIGEGPKIFHKEENI